MKLLVIVPTTGGPAILRRLKVRPGLPVSSAFVDGDYRPLPWSADYARLAGPGGPIARALKTDLPPHELRLDQSFDAGRSWEAPVSAAHLMLASGDVELTDTPENADLLVWTTGAVDLDLALIPGDYAVADKLERSRALFEPARKIMIALPPGTPSDAANAFESDPKIRVVRGATARAIADAALGREPVAASALEPPANARLTKWIGIAALVAAGVGTAGVFLADDRAPPRPIEDPRPVEVATPNEDPKPAEDPKPVEQTAPPLDPPSVTIAEVRAPQGGTCEQVLFGSVWPETREVEPAGPDAFAPSRLDGALCGLVIRPTVAGGTVQVTGGLSAVTGAPRPAPGGGTLYMLRAGARQKVVYEAQGLSKDAAAPSGRMRHELVP